MNVRHYLFLPFFIILISAKFTVAESQTVLMVEDMRDIRPIKYYEGQFISVKTVDFPDYWLDIKIERLLDEEKIILYDGGMINLSDITHFRRTRGWVKAISYTMQTFGIAWLTFATLGDLAGHEYQVGADTFVIGGGAIVTGWLLRKFFRYKKYKINKKVRLRILDLSFPSPTE